MTLESTLRHFKGKKMHLRTDYGRGGLKTGTWAQG